MPLYEMNTERLKIIALQDLVQRLVRESGAPTDFDAHAWVTAWIREPHPALGNTAPLDVLDTPNGYEKVRTLLLRMQSGAHC